MSAPAAFAISVANGTAGAQYVESVDVTDFVAGQTLWLSLYYRATRATGTDTLTLQYEVEWWDTNGTALTPTSTSVVISATTPWSYAEASNLAPANAVRGRVKVILTPSGAAHQFDSFVTGIRLTKSQTFATAGGVWGSNITNIPSNLGALTGSEDIKNSLVDIGQDIGGTGGRARLRILSSGAYIGNFLQLNDNVQNLGIAVGSGRLQGIGTGNNTYVDNANLSFSSSGILAYGGGTIGQATIPGLAGTTYKFAADTRDPASIYTGSPNLLFNGSLRLSNSAGNTPVGWSMGAGWQFYSGVGPNFYLTNQTSVITTCFSDPIPVSANAAYTLQAELYNLGLTAGVLYVDVLWYSDAAGNTQVGDGANTVAPANSNWAKVVGNYTAPSNAASARVRLVLDGPGSVGTGQIGGRRFKWYTGSAETPFSDEATNSAEILRRSGTGWTVGAVSVDGSGNLQGIGSGVGTPVSNNVMGWSQDFNGPNGRWRMALTTNGTNLGFATPDDRIQNYGITVASGKLSGIGTGTGAYVDNTYLSMASNGTLTNNGSLLGQVTYDGIGDGTTYARVRAAALIGNVPVANAGPGKSANANPSFAFNSTGAPVGAARGANQPVCDGWLCSGTVNAGHQVIYEQLAGSYADCLIRLSGGTSVPANGSISTYVLSHSFAVTPGTTFAINAMRACYSNVALPAGISVTTRVYAAFYYADGSLAGTSSNLDASGNNTSMASNTVNGVVPTNAVFCQLNLQQMVSNSTGAAIAVGSSGQLPADSHFANVSFVAGVNPSTGEVASSGSTPPMVPSGSFTYSSTTSSVTINWNAFTVYRPDGTTVAISSGSYVINSLAAGASYKVYPYMADNGGTSGTVSWVTSGAAAGTGSPSACFSNAGDAGAAANMYARGNIPLGSFTVSTPSSGTSSGGGGGLTCLHPSMWVNGKRAGALQIGDTVKCPNGELTVREVRRGECSRWYVVHIEGREAARVTAGHLFYRASGETVRADALKLGDLLATIGDHVEVTGLMLDSALADFVGIDVGGDHRHFAGPFNLLMHNGTVKP